MHQEADLRASASMAAKNPCGHDMEHATRGHSEGVERLLVAENFAHPVERRAGSSEDRIIRRPDHRVHYLKVAGPGPTSIGHVPLSPDF
jgi:hypothetical protein